MSAWSEFLNPEERKRLSGLSLALAVALLLVIASLFFWSYRLDGLRAEARRLTAELEKIGAQKEQARIEFQSWQETRKDLEEMETTAFYSGSGGQETFRQDLRDLFKQAGLPVPAISYQYDDTGKKQFRRLAASFALRFSYPSFKRFLYRVETWPRLLVIDQINFQKIDNASGALDLRITLSGYYHEKEK
ncbi:MAG: type II secretion system protein M [Candidatus Saccharicenans sp.]|jgi:Tfp pilus assembly protein PilO|nr:type II secretion system protein M [Candidatus Saccharicenans sp.]MDH7492639.1 GspMb/PilO family protein [Candidatus Saccharicenans sp.]